MIRIVSLLVSIPVVIIVATFAYRNAQLVTIDFFTSKFDFPLAGILLISILLGVLLGFIINLTVLLKQKNKIRQLTKQRHEMISLTEALKMDDKRL
ncbi:MAG: LapA family protein [Gammaproteobacteria bacterium]|nr:LapA family protein [Gammaproteobacteria bacterium]MDH5734810.1 LapA family protein [Gammaproteobacteria bacterium]